MLSAHPMNKLFTTRYFLLAILLLACLLPLSSIDKGLQTDDYLHWSTFDKAKICSSFTTKITCNKKEITGLSGINSLFTFIEPSSAEYQLAKSTGALPWWTSTALKINFWRPLAAFTHWLDYQLWPNNSKLMHLHNIIWYVFLVFACFYFYRSVLQTEPLAHLIVPLATLLFCLDFSNFANISWLANRNSLMCALMCVLALNAHHQWRTQHGLHFLILSQLLFVLALASNESGLIAFLWIVAYNLVFEKSSLKEKLIATLPSFFILIAWQIFYKNLAYGFSHSGLYLHPIYDFSIVLFSIIEKLPVFIFSQLFGIEGFYNGFAPEYRYFFSFSCFSLSAIFLLAIYKSIPLNRTLTFLVLCTALAFVPASAFALVEIRMSLYAGIFSALFFSYVLVHSIKLIYNNKKQTKLKSSAILVFIIFTLIFAHIVLASAQWALQWRGFSLGKEETANISYLIKPLISEEKNEIYENKDIIILGSPAVIDYYYLSSIAKYYSLTTPRSINLLALNYASYDIRVKNKNTLELTSPGLLLNRFTQRNIFNSAGVFSSWYAIYDLNGIFTSVDANIAEHHLNGATFTATINNTNATNQITNLIFTFDNNLEDKNYIFLYWDKNKYTTISYENLKTSAFHNAGL